MGSGQHHHLIHQNFLRSYKESNYKQFALDLIWDFELVVWNLFEI